MHKKNILPEKYIILEIIPTAISPEKGPIAQISALKLNNLQLIDRFDYRLEKNKIYNQDILNMIDYDNEKFEYLDSNEKILNKFKNWIKNYPILIIDNEYTRNYLKEIQNKKISIFQYLNIDLTVDVIDNMIKKYNLEASDHIVDLLYEALIYESNKSM